MSLLIQAAPFYTGVSHPGIVHVPKTHSSVSQQTLRLTVCQALLYRRKQEKQIMELSGVRENR